MLHLFSLNNDWKNKGCSISHILVGLSIETFSQVEVAFGDNNCGTNMNKKTTNDNCFKSLQQLSIENKAKFL